MSEKEPLLREKILNISRHLLYNDGHTSLSMRGIAKEVGVSATSIYLHFDNKDHLLHTLIEESVEALSASIEERVDEQHDEDDDDRLDRRQVLELVANHAAVG